MEICSFFSFLFCALNIREWKIHFLPWKKKKYLECIFLRVSSIKKQSKIAWNTNHSHRKIANRLYSNRYTIKFPRLEKIVARLRVHWRDLLMSGICEPVFVLIDTHLHVRRGRVLARRNDTVKLSPLAREYYRYEVYLWVFGLVRAYSRCRANGDITVRAILPSYLSEKASVVTAARLLSNSWRIALFSRCVRARSPR